MSRSDIAPAYTCGTYHRRGRAGCTSHHIRVDKLDELMRLYIRRVMDSSAEMLDRLNAELAREDNQIVETEQSADNLAEVLDDLTAELKATKRQRIRDIEEMALPGSEQITNEAKYDKPMSASDYAKAAMKNAKEQGAAWLNTMQQGANASGVNSVGSAPAPTGGEKPDEFMDAIKGLGKKQ